MQYTLPAHKRSICKENACCKEKWLLMFSVYVIKFKISLYSLFCSGLVRQLRWLYKTPPKLKCNDKLAFIVCLPGIFLIVRFIRMVTDSCFSTTEKNAKRLFTKKQHILWINMQTYMYLHMEYMNSTKMLFSSTSWIHMFSTPI